MRYKECKLSKRISSRIGRVLPELRPRRHAPGSAALVALHAMKEKPPTPLKDQAPAKQERRPEPQPTGRTGNTGEGAESALRRLREAEKRKAEAEACAATDKPNWRAA